MFVRSIPLAALTLCGVVSIAPANDAMPSAQEIPVIEAHASSWEIILKREQLRIMTTRWSGLVTKPDSAAILYERMLTLANDIADRLTVATGLSRRKLMRWLESHAGLKPYFFPPRPEQRLENKGNALLKILSPLVPIILYRVVDRVLDD